MKTNRARDAVAVENRHGGRIELGTEYDQLFRQGCAFEKTDGGACMELDVGHQSYIPSRNQRSTALQTRYRRRSFNSTSHSSRAQGVVVHQSPEPRQG